jgi:hypothetical protein
MLFTPNEEHLERYSIMPCAFPSQSLTIHPSPVILQFCTQPCGLRRWGNVEETCGKISRSDTCHGCCDYTWCTVGHLSQEPSSAITWWACIDITLIYIHWKWRCVWTCTVPGRRIFRGVAELSPGLYHYHYHHHHHHHHSVFCLTTGPKLLLKRFLHIVRSRASLFQMRVSSSIFKVIL